MKQPSIKQLLQSMNALNELTPGLHRIEMYGDGSGFLLYRNTTKSVEIGEFLNIFGALALIDKRRLDLLRQVKTRY